MASLSVRRIVVLAFLWGAVIQAIVILYVHFSGYAPVANALGGILRWLWGTALTGAFAFPLMALDLRIIRVLTLRLPWERRLPARVAGECILAALIGGIIGMLLSLVSHATHPYANGLFPNMVNNALIGAVVNLLTMTGLEAMLAYQGSREARAVAENLARENAQIRFQMLREQLNPHFLFNSLNVLSSLIARDPERAQRFIEEFSSIYRYTLDVIDRPVTDLRSELAFARSYFYLQQLRFGDAVCVDIAVDATAMEWLLPPLALQTVLENAFKHNGASAETPLRISISSGGGSVIVRNTLQPRFQTTPGHGIGLKNLTRRYALVMATPPAFHARQSEFVAELPLLPPA